MQVSSRLPRPLPLTSKNDWGQVRHDLVIVRNTGSDMFTLFPLYFPVHVFFFPLFFPVLEGEDIEKEHCVLDFVKGKVTFEPISSMCWVNGVAVTQATKLNQGMVIS